MHAASKEHGAIMAIEAAGRDAVAMGTHIAPLTELVFGDQGRDAAPPPVILPTGVPAVSCTSNPWLS